MHTIYTICSLITVAILLSFFGFYFGFNEVTIGSLIAGIIGSTIATILFLVIFEANMAVRAFNKIYTDFLNDCYTLEMKWLFYPPSSTDRILDHNTTLFKYLRELRMERTYYRNVSFLFFYYDRMDAFLHEMSKHILSGYFASINPTAPWDAVYEYADARHNEMYPKNWWLRLKMHFRA